EGEVCRWVPAAGTGALPVPLTGHRGGVWSLAGIVLPTGQAVLAAGDDEGEVRLWDPTTGTAAHTAPLTGHRGGVWSLAGIVLPRGEDGRAGRGAQRRGRPAR